jgi:hypothetical protein
MGGKPTCEPPAGATRHFSPVVIATSTREQIRAGDRVHRLVCESW